MSYSDAFVGCDVDYTLIGHNASECAVVKEWEGTQSLEEEGRKEAKI